MLLIITSAIACAIPTPSSGLVPLPSSSTMTKHAPSLSPFSGLCASKAAKTPLIVVISEAKVEREASMLSSFERRVRRAEMGRKEA